jgi:hypothetical protein
LRKAFNKKEFHTNKYEKSLEATMQRIVENFKNKILSEGSETEQCRQILEGRCYLGEKIPPLNLI